jgi:mannosyltransferase
MNGQLEMRVSDRHLAISRRTEVVLLAGIVVVAAVLRFYKLGAWSLWIDEIYTIGRIQAHYSSLEATLRNIPPSTNWFPVSLMLTSLLIKVLGISAWSARVASVLIGLATIPTLYLIVKKLFDGQIALISALLLAISPWHLTWSQNARFYTAVMLFYFLAMIAIYLGVERNRRLYIVLGLLFFYLAASERIFALFLVPVIACYLLCLFLLPVGKPQGLNRTNLAILSLPLVAGLLIEGANLLTIGSSRFFGGFDWFRLYRNYTPLRLLAAIVFSTGPVLTGAALVGSYSLLRQKSRAGLLLSIAATLPVGLLLLLSPFMFTKDRYVFFILPAVIVLAATAAQAIWERLQGQHKVLATALLVVLVADAVETNILYYRAYDGNRLDWQAAFQLVEEEAGEQDAVVAFWPEFGAYYLQREILPWEEVNPQEIVAMGRRAWFIVDSETIWGDLRKKAWLERNAELIEVLYLRTPAENYLRIYLYDPERITGTGAG